MNNNDNLNLNYLEIITNKNSSRYCRRAFNRWKQVHPENMSAQAVENVMLPLTLSSITSLVVGQQSSGHVHGGMPRLPRGSTLHWCSGSWVPPGAQWPASCAETVQALPGRWSNWYHWLEHHKVSDAVKHWKKIPQLGGAIQTPEYHHWPAACDILSFPTFPSTYP